MKDDWKDFVLTEKWLKATALGTVWAASEIVLGSFLHNLRIPFSGNLLTAIATILLIAACFRWKENGILWRAGLITALMKTASPSAVIFGPMIAIFMEAVLLDLTIRFLGRNWAAYIFGAVLAMSWVLLQRIFNLILFYGLNLVELYTSLMKMAENQLQIETDLVWLPLILLMGIHLVMGIIAGIAGIRVGRKLHALPDASFSIQTPVNISNASHTSSFPFPFSLFWLFVNILFVAGSLILFYKSSIQFWLPYTIVVLFIWTQRYRAAIKQLTKLKFWVWFILITLIASFGFLRLQGDPEYWMNGMILSFQMNSRAAILIIGFSVIGKELYNPALIGFFRNSKFRQLQYALQLAFETVPNIIAVLPSPRKILVSPQNVIILLLKNAEKFVEIWRNQESLDTEKKEK